ncbi:MAG: hypothetical protein RRY65_03475 [Pseudoflavonifractor sp.]
MAGLDAIRGKMVELLQRGGMTAVTAWDDGARKRRAGTVVAVSLKSCEGGPAGFQDYLGERYNTAAQKWEDLYGKRVRLVFGLDLYAEKGGEAVLQTALNALTDALQQGAPEGLRLGELSSGETEYNETLGLYHCPVEAACDAYLYAVADDGGTILDFEVRGERRN